MCISIIVTKKVYKEKKKMGKFKCVSCIADNIKIIQNINIKHRET